MLSTCIKPELFPSATWIYTTNGAMFTTRYKLKVEAQCHSKGYGWLTEEPEMMTWSASAKKAIWTCGFKQSQRPVSQNMILPHARPTSQVVTDLFVRAAAERLCEYMQGGRVPDDALDAVHVSAVVHHFRGREVAVRRHGHPHEAVLVQDRRPPPPDHMNTSRVSGPKPPAARQDQIVWPASSHACVSCYPPVQLPSCPVDEEVLDHLLPQTLLLYYSCHRHLCSDIAWESE